MDTDTIIGIGIILFALFCLYIGIKGLVTIFKTLKRNGNTIGIILMILLTIAVPLLGLGIGAIYDAFIDDGSALKEAEAEEKELLNEESD